MEDNKQQEEQPKKPAAAPKTGITENQKIWDRLGQIEKKVADLADQVEGVINQMKRL